jgi:exoribonuclease-2
MPGMAQVARGAQVKLDILRWDELDLSVEARVLEVLGQTDLGEDDAEDEADADVAEEMSADNEAAAGVNTSEDAQPPETEPQDAVDTGLNAV